MSAHPLLFSRHHSHPLHLLRGAPFPDCLFPFFLKIKPKPSSGCVSRPARHPPAILVVPGEEEGSSSSTFVGTAAISSATSTPPRASLFLPPRLAQGEPAPSSLTDPHPDRPAPAAARGPLTRLLRRETRAGKAAGPTAGGDAGKAVASEAAEGWAGTGRLRRLGPQRPRLASPPARPPAPPACPPRRRKRRRLGSAQFKLSPRPPLLPSPPAAAPRALRLPAAPLAPLAPRAFPNSAGGRRGSARPEPGPGWPGGRGLRLTHGAAVDAPLLGSSGSRTDRHPLPLRDQPRRGAAAGFSKASYADSAA